MDIHKVLSSEVRRNIVLTLAEGDKYLTELANELHKAPQTLDFHLSQLEEIGILESKWREGKKYYSLTDRKILKYLREKRPLPPHLHHRPPHVIMEELEERMDRIEKKIDKLLKK